jgi:DNA-binding transcriptional LysR family regulator
MRLMDRFAGIGAFVAVVEAGSFVRAADRLRASTSTLSRLISELELHLGARLLNRTTRKLSLTESGQAFYERAVQLLADLEEAEALAGSSATAPRGLLRITCSHAMAVQRIAAAVAGFAAQYPELRFEVSVSDRIVDLVEEGFDLAIRIGQAGSDQLVARKLGVVRMLVCAAPKYLKAHGTPRTPGDLARHRVLTYAYSPNPRVWRLLDVQGRVHEVRVAGPLHANSGDLSIAAAVAGLGIVFEPDFMLQPALEAGRLVRVLPAYQSSPGDIWAVYPGRRHLSAKVRLFVEHVARSFPPPTSERSKPRAG